jgi:predicted kinase
MPETWVPCPRAERDAFAGAFADAAPLLFVECRAPLRVLLHRAAARERDAGRVSDATADVVRRESERWEALDEVDAEAHVVLRTDRPVEDTLADLAALLDRRAPPARVRP